MDESRRPRNPPSGLLPIFQSQHQASEFLADKQRRGLLKRCAHLSIPPVDIADSIYQILCAKDSFEVPPPHVEFMGSCPKRCRLYQPFWRARISRWRRGVHPVIWFERRPWQVQVALIAFPIALAVIYFHAIQELASLVRAIGEVWRGK